MHEKSAIYLAACHAMHLHTVSIYTALILRTLEPCNDFTLLDGWICLHGVLD